MFPRPESSQPDNKVVQLPFPQKVEDFRDVHVQELDRRFGNIINNFIKTKTFRLTRGRYHDIEHHIVTLGGISPEIFEAYLRKKGFTRDTVTPIGDMLKK